MSIRIKGTTEYVPTIRINHASLLTPGNCDPAVRRNRHCRIGTRIIAAADRELVSTRAAIRVERAAEYVGGISRRRRIGHDDESSLAYRPGGLTFTHPSQHEATIRQGSGRRRSLAECRGLIYLKFGPDFVACGRKELRIDAVDAAVLAVA